MLQMVPARSLQVSNNTDRHLFQMQPWRLKQYSELQS